MPPKNQDKGNLLSKRKTGPRIQKQKPLKLSQEGYRGPRRGRPSKLDLGEEEHSEYYELDECGSDDQVDFMKDLILQGLQKESVQEKLKQDLRKPSDIFKKRIPIEERKQKEYDFSKDQYDLKLHPKGKLPKIKNAFAEDFKTKPAESKVQSFANEKVSSQKNASSSSSSSSSGTSKNTS